VSSVVGLRAPSSKLLVHAALEVETTLDRGLFRFRVPCLLGNYKHWMLRAFYYLLIGPCDVTVQDGLVQRITALKDNVIHLFRKCRVAD
jgi:hypothetical protein